LDRAEATNTNIDSEMMDEIKDSTIDSMKSLIDQAHLYGIDIPEKLKDQLKGSPFGNQLNLDSKLSNREKAKAQQ
jgi:hypothetical protein